MSVFSVVEVWGPRQGGYNELAQRDYTRGFQVRTTSQNDGVTVAGSAVDPNTGIAIPKVFSFYTDQNGNVDKGAFVRSVEPKQDQDDPYTWLVTVRYSSLIGRLNLGRHNDSAEAAQKGQTDQNPLNRPTVIRLQTQNGTRIVHYDLKGRLIANSAGQPLPSKQLDDSRLLLTFSKNLAASNFGQAGQYKDAVNSASFFGFGPDEVKCVAIEQQFNWENAQGYWKFDYSFLIRTETTPNATGWAIDEIIPDQGWYQLDANSKPQKINDNTGGTPSGPFPLDGNGKVAAVGKGANLAFTFYNRLDLNALGLP